MSVCPTEENLLTSADIPSESKSCVIDLLKSKNIEICKLENDKLAIGLGLFDLFLFIIAVFFFHMYMTRE